jgi:hypothetical protein
MKPFSSAIPGPASRPTEDELLAIEIDRLFAAVDEVNEAWAAFPRRVRLWVDWQGRKIVVQTLDMSTKDHDEMSLKATLLR